MRTTSSSVTSVVLLETPAPSSPRNGSLVTPREEQLYVPLSSLDPLSLTRDLSQAWMMNSLAQILQSGIIPGNRNADNVSPELRKFEYLVYPSKSIQTDGIKAGLLTSFGFGQVGGQCLVIHPQYLLGSLEPSGFDSYKKANDARRSGAYRKFNEVSPSLLPSSTPY